MYNVQSELKVKNAKIVKYKSVKQNDPSLWNSEKKLLENRFNNQIEQLKQEYEQKLRKEKNNAFSQGLQKGKKEALDNYKQKFQQTFDKLNNINAEFKKNFNEIIESREQEIIALILEIARKVVDVQIDIDENIVLNTLQKCLKTLNEKDKIKIVVNPKDWIKVRENIHKLNLHIELPEDVEISSSERIEAGGCKIENEGGSIDGDIKTQFAELKRKLMKNVANS